MIRALYVPLALGALLAFAAPARGQTTVISGDDDCQDVSINGKCYSCPDDNYGNLESDSCQCEDGSACTLVKSDGTDVADKTEDAATTAADATKDAATTAADATTDAADKAAAEATAIASGVTAAVSSASFATGASAVFGAAMVLMA